MAGTIRPLHEPSSSSQEHDSARFGVKSGRALPEAVLADTNVALGVTGSIAAVRTVELTHELRRAGATVRGVMTDAARGIVHPWALEFGTDHEVVTEITGSVEHVSLCGADGWADVLLVAPATANTVGKMAAAVDDTPVTTCATTAIGADLPVVVAPAMHEPMHDHPGVTAALAQLESWGVELVPSRVEEGKAKIAAEAAIVTAVARAAGDRPLDGQRVVVTAGGTVESIDPVRMVASRASGRTGRAVAGACHVLGADVHLVHAGLGEPPAGTDGYATVETVESAGDLRAATLDALEGADTFVSAAAVGDFTLQRRAEKIPSGDPVSLELEPTPKLIDTAREAHPDLTIVGFKVESEAESVEEGARALLDRVGAAFVVGNHADVMGRERTRATLVWPNRTEAFEGPKGEFGSVVGRALATALDG